MRPTSSAGSVSSHRTGGSRPSPTARASRATTSSSSCPGRTTSRSALRSAAKPSPQPGSRMLAAILKLKSGNYFLKLTGPDKTVAAAAEAFRASFGGDKTKESGRQLSGRTANRNDAIHQKKNAPRRRRRSPGSHSDVFYADNSAFRFSRQPWPTSDSPPMPSRAILEGSGTMLYSSVTSTNLGSFQGAHAAAQVDADCHRVVRRNGKQVGARDGVGPCEFVISAF